MAYAFIDNNKYKNQIFEIGGVFEEKSDGLYFSCFGRSEKIGNIVKKADTIEELCDEFVLEHPLFASNCKTLYHSLEKAKNGIKKHNDDAHKMFDFIIYGAIWTNKGLIYVAKMNDKGELERL